MTRTDVRVISSTPSSIALRSALVAYLLAVFGMTATGVRFIGPLTASDVLFVASTIMALGGVVASRQRNPTIPLALVLCALTVVVGGVISSFNAFDPGVAVYESLRFGYVVILWT